MTTETKEQLAQQFADVMNHGGAAVTAAFRTLALGVKALAEGVARVAALVDHELAKG